MAYQLNECDFEQTVRDSEQGCLVCCRTWGPKELDMTQRLNNYNVCVFESVKEILARNFNLNIMGEDDPSMKESRCLQIFIGIFQFQPSPFPLPEGEHFTFY